MITAIFDLDGTLADTLADLADATNAGLRKLGYPEHSYDSYRRFVGNGVQKLCYRALPEEHKDDTDKLLELFREYYGEHFLDKTCLYDGIGEAVNKLFKAGVKVAIATNKPQDFAREIAAALLPEIEFVKVLGGCAERPKKPDTAIIKDILEALPEQDNKVYMIGDSDVDVMTGKGGGAVTIGCAWGFRGVEELQKAGADYIARKASDISDFILGDNA